MPLSQTALAPLLRLALTEGIGPQRLSLLLHRYGSAERSLAAPASELARLPWMSTGLAARVREQAGPAGEGAVHRALRGLQARGAVALTPDDLCFPECFRLLPDPPYLLFAAGRLELLERPSVALVGTRRPSRYGIRAARELAAGLAEAGFAVVSGMARGIDTAAHAAALEVGGLTVGVLGHGIDAAYPAENRELFERVASAGLLITEYVPGEGPKAGNFPRRNRLIAALARAVVVVEMGSRSGAQHTVTYALEQGREVMAVPGPFGEAASAGSNQLLKDGARVVTSVADVVEELQGVGAPQRPAGRTPPEESAAPLLPLFSPEEAVVLESLDDEARHVDAIAATTRLVPSAILPSLLELELKGAVEALPGMRYRRR